MRCRRSPFWRLPVSSRSEQRRGGQKRSTQGNLAQVGLDNELEP